MSTFAKYTFFQIPGWILAVLVLMVLNYWVDLSGAVAAALLAVWVVKDLVMYPLVRAAYQADGKSGAALMIGARGVAQQELSPSGYVRVRGELWMAESTANGESISPGSSVRVVAVRGTRLIVEREKA